MASISQTQLKQLINYDPETGLFTRGQKIAGADNGRGYIRIRIDDKLYLAHRLAWLYVYGKWPNSDLDHINRCRSDNRINNLREITRSENLINTNLRKDNTTGVKGVYWDKKQQKWLAQIRRQRRNKHLGYFAVFDDAVEARRKAEQAAS